VAETALPEREPLPAVYESLGRLIAAIETEPGWPADYVRWELGLLTELGFGLDLGRCAVTGTTDDLAYVSPRSGRAVSAAAGAPWKDRLLPLPAFLVDASAPASGGAVAAGLALTGYFLLRHVYAEQGRALPAARARLPQEIARAARSAAKAEG
jgi:DNA repair protein RecO (recombination protein O)